MGKRTESFWDFSVRCYEEPGVADACLTLQESHALDVNLILYCCWMGVSRGRCEKATFEAVLSFSELWSGQVVRPLRGARAWMKSTGCEQLGDFRDACMALRERVKALELEAEKLQQNVLAAMTGSGAQRIPASAERLSAVVANLRMYLVMRRADLDAASLERLATIVATATGGVARADALTALTRSFAESEET
jgi:uncharacterized protein (TIGR02444 family)